MRPLEGTPRCSAGRVLPARFGAPAMRGVAAAEPAAAAARRFGARFVDGETASAEFVAVERVDRFLGVFMRAHFHEAEAARAAGRLIAHDRDGLHAAGLREQLLQFRFVDLIRKIPNIQFLTHRTLLCRRRDTPTAGPAAGGFRLVARLNVWTSESEDGSLRRRQAWYVARSEASA